MKRTRQKKKHFHYNNDRNVKTLQTAITELINT